jgi:AcrR family transcriptional regulator
MSKSSARSKQSASATDEGRRARKRRETRDRITDAAMALFLARGFDAATVDDIAAAADVSKRSFFDYFPTKEDVIFAWQDEFGGALAAAVAARPADEPLTKVVEEALTSVIVAAADPRALAIGKLVRDTPALRARDHLKYAKLEQQLGDALSARTKGDADTLRARLIAMITVGAMRVAGEAWHAKRRTETPAAFAKKVFRTIWAELRALGQTAGGE